MSRVNVIVVGAGFAGLSAAQALAAAGLSTLVLEAQGRVGGRVKGRLNALGEACDLGGQFLCDEMPALLDLVRAQAKRLAAPGRPGPDRGGEPPSPPGTAGKDPTAAAFERAQVLYRSLRDAADGREKAVERAGERSLAAWVEGLSEPPAVAAALRSLLACIFCGDLAEVRLWQAIDHGARSPVGKNEMQYVVAEGLYKVAEDLAAAGPMEIRMNSAVTQVDWDAGGVRVTAAGRTWQAREVILALPPPVVPKIGFAPPLPPAIAAALAAYRQGAVIKFLLRYEAPFWRRQGRDGIRQWSEPLGLYVGDASRDAAAPQLVGFLGGPEARRWHRRGPEAIREAFQGCLESAFGADAAKPLTFDFECWVDEAWSGGGYSASIVKSGARNAEALLRAGRPPLNFASTEIAAVFPGYVEGALRAGRDVAAAVAARLGAPDQPVPHLR